MLRQGVGRTWQGMTRPGNRDLATETWQRQLTTANLYRLWRIGSHRRYGRTQSFSHHGDCSGAPRQTDLTAKLSCLILPACSFASRDFGTSRSAIVAGKIESRVYRAYALNKKNQMPAHKCGCRVINCPSRIYRHQRAKAHSIAFQRNTRETAAWFDRIKPRLACALCVT